MCEVPKSSGTLQRVPPPYRWRRGSTPRNTPLSRCVIIVYIYYYCSAVQEWRQPSQDLTCISPKLRCNRSTSSGWSTQSKAAERSSRLNLLCISRPQSVGQDSKHGRLSWMYNEICTMKYFTLKYYKKIHENFEIFQDPFLKYFMKFLIINIKWLKTF